MKTLLVLAALALLLGQAATATAALGPGDSAGRVHTWSPQYMDGTAPVPVARAVDDARSFDLIAAHASAYRLDVAAMKAANPNVQLFAYMKGTFTYDTKLGESQYAHGADGRRIQGVEYPGTWLLDPRSPQVLARQIQRAQMLVRLSGYDGVFLDTLGTAPLNPGYVTAPPVDPTTGQPWTQADWLGANAALAGRIATALGRPVVGNGLRDGRSYFQPDAPTEVLLGTGLGAGMAESWLRGAGNPIGGYPSEASWRSNVDALVDAGADGSSFLAVTKLWTSGTPAEKDAWYTFAVASFLLGNDGHSDLSVSYEEGDATEDYALAGLDLGGAVGPYTKEDGVYQRSFCGGRVLVNPSATTAYTVQLERSYLALDGTSVSSVTLAPHGASILRATAAPLPA
jgi:hypothetical protein